MSVDRMIRDAALETRAAFSERPHPPTTRIANRAVVHRFASVATGVVLVVATIGVAGWVVAGGPGSVVQAPAPPDTAVTATSPSGGSTHTTLPSTTVPASTVAVDDGLSDRSAIPEGWRDDFPEDGRFLLLDSGIALAAFPNPDSANDWWISVAQGPDFVSTHSFGPADQGVGMSGVPEAWILLAFSDDRSEFVLAGIAPADASTIEVAFGDAEPVTIDRVFERPEIGRTVFIGSFPARLLLELEPPVPVHVSVADTAGEELELPEIGHQGSSVRQGYAGPITGDLFVVPPPLLTDSITADSLPEVVSCQGGPGVDDPPPNRGREITDGDVLPSARAALEALLAGELSDSRYPHGGYVEIGLGDDSTAYAFPLNGNLEDGAVVLIEVARTTGGWTVTSWETSGC